MPEIMGIPEFLSVVDADEIEKELLSIIPDEYDKSEGQHYYNFTMPTANIVSQLRGFDLPKAIGLIWPRFAFDEFLDYHADRRQMKRKEAQYASGEITITGTPGTVIPAGYNVSTESKNDIASKDYATTEKCTIGENGTVTVAAVSLAAGKIGNTAAGTIVVNSSSFDDVTEVINIKPFKGGIDEEDDESLIKRIDEYDLLIGDRNTGNPSDYKRWAQSVDGTGSAKVVRAKDTSGLVTIILLNGNGDPADEELCQKVYNYIMSPDNEDDRLAPCGAYLSVIPPETLVIDITANVELTAGTIGSVKEAYAEKLNDYFRNGIKNNEILYQKVCNILSNIDGVYDYSELTLKGGKENLLINDGTFPIISAENINLTLVT